MILTALSARAIAWVTGIGAQAIAVAVAVALVIGGIWWLRYDARMDERRAWETRMANARVADQIKAMFRERKRQDAARKAADEAARAAELAEAAAKEAEAGLPTKRLIVWPVDVVRAINK